MEFNNFPTFNSTNTNTTTTTTTVVPLTINTSTMALPYHQFPPLYPHQIHPSNLYPFQPLPYQSNQSQIPSFGFPYPTVIPSMYPVFVDQSITQHAQTMSGIPSNYLAPCMFAMPPPVPVEQIRAQNAGPTAGFRNGAIQNYSPSNINQPRISDPSQSKEARNRRMTARRMTATATAPANEEPSPSSHGTSSTRGLPLAVTSTTSITQGLPPAITPTNKRGETDPYIYVTSDGIKLKFLLMKVLERSDVGSLRRIVLSKRAAEENLPWLTVKEGIELPIREIDSPQIWSMRYRFWPNNKSRMYVLEKTGEYVKQHKLVKGDIIAIYEDRNKQLYISCAKTELLYYAPVRDNHAIQMEEPQGAIVDNMNDGVATSSSNKVDNEGPIVDNMNDAVATSSSYTVDNEDPASSKKPATNMEEDTQFVDNLINFNNLERLPYFGDEGPIVDVNNMNDGFATTSSYRVDNEGPIVDNMNDAVATSSPCRVDNEDPIVDNMDHAVATSSSYRVDNEGPSSLKKLTTIEEDTQFADNMIDFNNLERLTYFGDFDIPICDEMMMDFHNKDKESQG